MCHADGMSERHDEPSMTKLHARLPILTLWVARAAWLAVPLGASSIIGAVQSDALRVRLEVLAWAIWTMVAAALLLARPLGLTAIRLSIAAGAWLCGALLLRGEPLPLWALALIPVALILLSRPLADELINGKSYGSELRFALRLPPAIALIGIPLSGLAWAGIAIGINYAFERDLFVAAAVLIPSATVAWLTTPSAHRMSERFLVFVPAGCVVSDPTALLDPVLMPGSHLRSVGSERDAASQLPGVASLDLRAGTVFGALRFRFTRPGRVAAKETLGGVMEVEELLITPARTVAFMDAARTRRVLNAKA